MLLVGINTEFAKYAGRRKITKKILQKKNKLHVITLKA